MELALAGETIKAEEAHSLGIVDQVVPGKQAFESAINYLRKITAERPMHVIHAVVRSAAGARRKSFEQGMDDQINLFCDLVLARKAAMTDER
jgi:enoyl-CoA hydratase/carnithine racemase